MNLDGIILASGSNTAFPVYSNGKQTAHPRVLQTRIALVALNLQLMSEQLLKSLLIDP